VLDGNMIIVTHTPAALAESIIIGKISGFYLIKEAGSLIKLLSIWYLPLPDEVPEEPSPHDCAWQPVSQSP